MATTPKGKQHWAAVLSFGTRIMVKHHKSNAIGGQRDDAEKYRDARNGYNQAFYPDRPKEA